MALRMLLACASLVGNLLGVPVVSAATTVVVTDDLGRAVRLASPPARVVSIAPSNTENLYALGAGDRLVAVNEWSDYPPEARRKPQIRGMRPSLEQLVALRPELILLMNGMEDLISQYEGRGMSVLVIAPRDLAGVYRDIELLGDVMKVPVQARALTRAMQDRVAGVRARVDGARRPRVFYEVDGVDPVRPFTAAPGSFIHELLELAGAENVAADAQGPWPQLSLEQLIKMDPEMIILGDTTGVYHAQTPERVLRRPGWEQITAVRRRAVYAVDGTLVSRPGPRIVEGLEALARIIHPDRFTVRRHPERLADSPAARRDARPARPDVPR